MALIVFAAIIFDRRAVSMRSVAVAAALVLVLHPESLLGAGFQMSFAATAALVAVYRYWADRRDFSNYQGPPGIFRRFWRGFTGLSVTSIVAGSATAGFAALHFHRFAKLGFIGNLAAMPVFTFLVMPAGFIAVLLIPLGMDGPFLKIMGLGLDYVLTVSDWVSARKGAVSYIKGANGTVTAVFGLGFVALCLGPKFVRVAGIAAIALAALMWANLSPPDMRISDQARIAYWQEDGDNILRVDSLRADGFGRRQFIEKSGVDGVELKPFEDTVAQCDHLACRIELKGKTVSVVSEPQGVMEACGDSDVVILTQRIAGPVARWKCDVTLVDADTFLEHGALDVSIDNGDVELKPANPPRRKARPWGR
jgi:competence protein ComEC